MSHIHRPSYHEPGQPTALPSIHIQLDLVARDHDHLFMNGRLAGLATVDAVCVGLRTWQAGSPAQQPRGSPEHMRAVVLVLVRRPDGLQKS